MEYGEYCWYSSWTRSTPNLKINNPSKIWRGLVPIHKFFLTNQILDSYRWIYMEGKIQKFPISCYGGKKVVWSRKLYIFSRHRYILNETLKENIVCMYQLFLIREPKNLTSNSWCDVCCPGSKEVTVKQWTFKCTINHATTTSRYFSTLWDICVQKSSKNRVLYYWGIPTWLLASYIK